MIGEDSSPYGMDRRTLLAGLVALVTGSVTGPATALGAVRSWDVGMQILAGARLRDPTLLELALEGLAREVGAGTVDRLLEAVLERDAQNIEAPFDDPAIESAARKFVAIVYTGEIPTADGAPAIGFHQALAWQVLHFTKAPSVCGPGMGWWTDPPDAS
jgi:hypothetical protein